MNFLLKKTLLTTVLLFCTFLLSAQSASIRGFLTDNADGEAAIFVKIKAYNEAGELFNAESDVNGFYAFAKLLPGKYTLKIEAEGYEKLEKEVLVERPNSIVDQNLKLKPQVTKNEGKELEGFVLSADQKSKRTETSVSKLTFRQADFDRVPSVGAENDITGALSITPGIISTGDQGGQLYVRGGTPIQNKILLDGMTVYTPFHSIGFFSVFETELIKNADVYTGGFDAKYGGRISSIMDISYRDGNRKEFDGKVSLSPFMAKVVLEGPFTKPKDDEPSNASYVFTAKHSLLDYTSESLYPRVNNGNGLPFGFTDLYGKVTLNSKGGSKFSFFGFHNDDKVKYDQLAEIKWKQSGGGMNFLLVPNGSDVFIRGYINASNYSLNFMESSNPNLSILGLLNQERMSSIGGANLGFDLTFFQQKQSQFDVGIVISGFSTKYSTINDAAQRVKDENFSFEVGTYVNYKIVRDRWVFQPGVRLQAYASRSTVSPEPRLSFKYLASDKMRLKISGGRFSQNFTSASSDKDVINLFNGLLSAPTNFQSTFVDKNGNTRAVNNGLQYAWHAIVGTEYDLTDKISVNIEGYYKLFTQLSNLNQNKLYQDIAEYSDYPDVSKKDFIIESGKSYGLDFLVKYTGSRLFVWTTYSWGYSTRWDGFEEYFPVFDRRHNANIVASYQFGKKKDFEVNVRWNFGSGLPFTPTVGYYQNEDFEDGVTTDINGSNSDEVSVLLGKFNSSRLPAYHRMDVTIKKNFKFKNRTNLELIGSVTNVYDRKNIFYVNRSTNEIIYQFPFLPSIGINYKL